MPRVWDDYDYSTWDRFEPKYKVDPKTGCWMWSGETTHNGYGKLYYRQFKEYAHRLSYKLFKGDIPDGLVIDHLCGVPLCVNPDHLDAVTQKTNVHRSAATRLTPELVRYLRKELLPHFERLSIEYDTTPVTLFFAMTGRNWSSTE